MSNIGTSNDSILNSSFESPITPFKYYGAFTSDELAIFVWSAGGNPNNSNPNSNNTGPAISSPGNEFAFPINQTGNQVLAIQSTSFIQQSVFLNAGTYIVSLYYVSRTDQGTELNPINISIDSTIIYTIDIAKTEWTFSVFVYWNQ
jgi:hypothetical protein